MYVFKRGSGLWPGPGEYTRVLSDGVKTARLCCPDCNTIGLLDHQIAADGRLTPSLGCPTAGCTFHEHAILADWEPT